MKVMRLHMKCKIPHKTLEFSQNMCMFAGLLCQALYRHFLRSFRFPALTADTAAVVE